ncbi:MAG: hypothetical protein IKC71_05190 [Clostridia bacterium]|nr:hypothetical protein [Clostridia bacterium]
MKKRVYYTKEESEKYVTRFFEGKKLPDGIFLEGNAKDDMRAYYFVEEETITYEKKEESGVKVVQYLPNDTGNNQAKMDEMLETVKSIKTHTGFFFVLGVIGLVISLLGGLMVLVAGGSCISACSSFFS